jgi:hypothetical protein
VFLHQRDPAHRIELPQHDDRRAERVGQRRERERAGVVQRAGGEVHGVLVQQPQCVEQREDDLAVGARAQRAFRFPGRARRVDHRRAGFAGGLDVGFTLGPARGNVVPREEPAPLGDHAPEHDDRPQLRELVAHRGDKRSLFGIDHDHRRI